MDHSHIELTSAAAHAVLTNQDRLAVINADMLDELPTWPEACVSLVATSPPYWSLRDYAVAPRVWGDGWLGQLGTEPTPQMYVEHLVEAFRAVRRVLHPSGTLWLNISDTYATSPGWDRGHSSALNGRKHDAVPVPGGRRRLNGLKEKDLCLIPERLAIALQDDGWWVRSHITWAKTAATPSSVIDRPGAATDTILLLAKSKHYYYDREALKERSVSTHSSGNGFLLPGRLGQKRGVTPWGPTRERYLRNFWLLGPDPMLELEHPATWPREVARRCILLGTSERGCCPACLAPCRRLTRYLAKPQRTGSSRAERDEQIAAGYISGIGGTTTIRPSGTVMAAPSETIGWEPTCKCDAGEPAPAIVLDPFSGTGRTLEVALQLGLRALGVELNPKWADASRARLAEFDGPHMFPGSTT